MTPMSTIVSSPNTSSRSSAPLMTKNTANRGADQSSARSIRSSESGQMLQNTVPSIMHTSSGEKPMTTSPMRHSSAASATVRNTNAMVMDIRLRLEWNMASSRVRAAPASIPSSRESTISMSGLTSTETMLSAPLIIALAMPKLTANTTRPTASSSATMGSSRLVSGPLALYWRTTISVAAGAVAAAIAPSVMAAGAERMSGRRKWKPSRARSTSAVATSACTMPMMKA